MFASVGFAEVEESIETELIDLIRLLPIDLIDAHPASQ